MNGLYDNLLMSYFGLKTFDPYSEYFYVEPLETGYMRIMSNGFTQNPKVEYSTDKLNWIEAQTYAVSTLDRVYIRRKKETWHAVGKNIGDELHILFKCNIGGNILSLIYGDEFDGQNEFPEGSSGNFSGLFRYDTADLHGSKIVDASKLLLPTNVTEYCYASMFQYCNELTSAPALPATTLAPYCYSSMFAYCTSLASAPALPATTLARNCYNFMFHGCTSLTTAPELPATTLAVGCYTYMFYNCTSLTTAPALPATTLQNECYARMFANTALTTAPELPATTLVTDCYDDMFQGCSSLQSVKCLATNPSSSYTTSWLYNVSPTGTFIRATDVEWCRDGNGIPEGWTVQNV